MLNAGKDLGEWTMTLWDLWLVWKFSSIMFNSNKLFHYLTPNRLMALFRLAWKARFISARGHWRPTVCRALCSRWRTPTSQPWTWGPAQATGRVWPAGKAPPPTPAPLCPGNRCYCAHLAWASAVSLAPPAASPARQRWGAARGPTGPTACGMLTVSPARGLAAPALVTSRNTSHCLGEN